MLSEDPRERAEKYVASVESALVKVTRLFGPSESRSNEVDAVVDAARRYASDARYLLSQGKYASALAAVAYAEGLLDALAMMKLIEPPFKSALSANRPPAP